MSETEKKPLGTASLLALGVNGIVGVGIFFVPADLAAKLPGDAGVLAFGLTALALLPVAWCFATLGRRFFEDGGPVVYARAAFGELASFVVGWIAYVSAIASTAAVVDGLVRALPASWGGRSAVGERVWTTGLVTALALLCARGISISAAAWTALTVVKLVPLVALVGAFFVAGGGTRPSSAPATAAWASIGLAVTFTYQGFEIVPVVAGQARKPERTIPLAVLGSLAIAALLYMMLQLAVVRALPDAARSDAPLADAALVYGGELLARVVQIGTSVSALGISVGMMAMTPRYLASLAAGGAIGFGIDRVAPNGAPLRALFVTWILVAALLQAGTRAELFALSSVAVLAQYVVTALALLVLASRRARGLSMRDRIGAVPAAIVGSALASGATGRECIVASVALAVGLAFRFAARRFSTVTSLDVDARHAHARSSRRAACSRPREEPARGACLRARRRPPR